MRRLRDLYFIIFCIITTTINDLKQDLKQENLKMFFKKSLFEPFYYLV